MRTIPRRSELPSSDQIRRCTWERTRPAPQNWPRGRDARRNARPQTLHGGSGPRAARLDRTGRAGSRMLGGSGVDRFPAAVVEPSADEVRWIRGKPPRSPPRLRIREGLSLAAAYPPCQCSAYGWPHRPGGGVCRWPDPPQFRLTTRAGMHRSAAGGKIRHRGDPSRPDR